MVVDGNVERVIARLFTVEEPLPRAKPAIQALADALTPDARPGDFAQAMMDLGATICTPKQPGLRALPVARALPGARRGHGRRPIRARRRRPEGKLRRGAAFVAVAAGRRACSCARAPPKGLLGGMAEVPGTRVDAPTTTPATRWRTRRWPRAGSELPGTVEHVFTHFPLRADGVPSPRCRQATPAPERLPLGAGGAMSTARRCPT